MRVGHVTASISRQAGGLFFSVRSLARATAETGAAVEVFGLRDAHSEEDASVWRPLLPKILPVCGPPSIGFSPALSAALKRSECEILHSQGIWQGISLAVHAWHRKTRRPYLVAPRGMLDSWALTNSRWKKRIAAALYEHRHLRDAACLHALCESEALSMRAYGLKNPICVIPNGVELPDRGSWISDHGMKSENILLFLGRLHPKKGLVNTLKAWAEIERDHLDIAEHGAWRFVIAGWDQGGHEAELKSLCDELGIKHRSIPTQELVEGTRQNLTSPVTFAGPAFGKQKDQLLQLADAFILPSFSEGLPMAVLEAWACRLPVVMTDQCNLPEGFAAGAAMRVGTDVESLFAGMRALTGMAPADLTTMGESGRRLVEECFTWRHVAEMMLEVYNWVLGGGRTPECVVLEQRH
jgi:glycosyltransferase involved in cell wall biosynthesis